MAEANTEVKSEQEDKDQFKHLDNLIEFASEKDLTTYQEAKIVEEMLNKQDAVFSQLSHEESKEVLQNLKLNGVTFWINRATGQTDITDPDQQQAGDSEQLPVSSDPVEVGDEEHRTLKVYDDEEGGLVEVSADERKVANSLQQKMDIATLVTAVIMMRMSDDKLYRGVDNGYSSFREYAEVRCPFGYRQAQRYAKVGRKFAPLLPDGVTSMSPDQKTLNGNIEKLGELGMTKLYELSKIDDADFSEIPSEGKVVLKDGTEIDIEEIKGQSAREFKRKLDEHRQYQKDLEEELNQTAIAKEKAEKRADQVEKDAETGRKYKDMFGQKSEQFEAQKSRILEARSKAADLNQVLSKVTDLDPEFESLVDELRDLHKMVDRGLQRLREDNLEALKGIRS